MKKRWSLIALKTIFFILLFSVTTVYADDCSVGRTPDGVYPMQDADIVMESEDIKVDVEKGFVECNFVFKNTGEEKDILMGFPAKMEDDGHNTSDKNLYFKDFKTFIDKNEIAVEVEKGVKPKDLENLKEPYYSSWYTFSVHFEAGETKRIKNTYSVVYTSYSTGETVVGYILKTGAFWKDKIGYAKVTFDFGDIELYKIEHIYPFSMHFEGNNKIVWEKSNFEPDFDLLVRYHKYYLSEKYFDEMEKNGGFGLDEAFEQVNTANKLVKESDKMPREELLEYYNKYIADGKSAIAKYILDKMPKGSIHEKEPVITDLYVSDGSEGDNSKVVVGKFEDENGDLVNVKLEVSHIENGKKVVDFSEVKAIGTYMLAYNGEEAFWVDFLKDADYDIELSVKDSQDNVDSKKIGYLIEPLIQDPAPTATVEVIKDQDKEHIETIAEANDINNQALENNSDIEKKNTKSMTAGKIIILIIGVSIVLLIIVLIIYVAKKKKSID